MSFEYQITVKPLAIGSADAPIALTFQVANHDDILKIVERVHGLQILPPDEVEGFSVGLKLLTEVLLRHRREPLFEKLWPHMSEFMRDLKSVSRPDKGLP